MHPHIPSTDLTALVRAAQRGDARAWDCLVRRFTPVLRRVVTRYRLSRHDVEDVVQVTWMQAYRSIGSLHEPAALPGWLVTTARRSALRALQLDTRETPVDEPVAHGIADPRSVEDEVMAGRLATALRDAVHRLPGRQRAVVRALLLEPAPSYERLASELRMPVGSIGPTRARSLERLRHDDRLVAAIA